MSTKFAVKSYDINGVHYLLDEEDNLILFNSEVGAKNYLSALGLSEDDISALSIEEITEEELKDNYLSERTMV